MSVVHPTTERERGTRDHSTLRVVLLMALVAAVIYGLAIATTPDVPARPEGAPEYVEYEEYGQP